ncbi:MAG TPA: DUF1697 domain-containing protein [Candidatus Paceibacterota bacterium]|nr:DUF1697 domain-containing protein [Candidatus Paceibacterota bacterium]
MTYVALLRGINVGGNRKVEMKKLAETFRALGFSNVKTFINSGNIIFQAMSKNEKNLTRKIEKTIEKDFKMPIRVLLKNLGEIKKIVKTIPKIWINDEKVKCDVMFLWRGIDKKSLVKELPFNSKIEDIKYVKGALIWRIDRKNFNKSRIVKRMVGSELYRQMTIRNPNSVRKIYALMSETARV